jgi:hypothetical protein
MFRAKLINDYERLDNSIFELSLNNSLYICFRRHPDLMKNWIEKSQTLEGTKLYSWFDESIDKEIIVYDDVHIEDWYKLISGNENQDSDNIDLWF